MARPAGADVIKEGRVRWKPTLDATLLVVVLNLTAVADFFFSRRIERTKARHL